MFYRYPKMLNLRQMNLCFVLSCIVLFACSRSAFIIERSIKDGYVVVAELSEDGMIENIADQIKLPNVVSGKSYVIARDNQIFISTYKNLHVLQQNEDSGLQLMSSLNIISESPAIALHPKEPVLYILSNKAISVIDTRNASNPKLVKRLLFPNEIRKVLGGEWPDIFIGCDIACKGKKMVVTIQDIPDEYAYGKSRFESLSLVFDISNPMEPKAERALETYPGSLAVSTLPKGNSPKEDSLLVSIGLAETGSLLVTMGFTGSHVFIAGNRLTEFVNFQPDAKQQMFNSSWFRKRGSFHGLNDGRIIIPGDVVEMKFVPDELNNYGVVYIATVHALTFYDTRAKLLLWRYTSGHENNLSDYFEHIYGMDTQGHNKAYLAAGEEGVYTIDLSLNRRKRNRFITRDIYTNLPGYALDVCAANDKLYILCGEINLHNVKYNESVKGIREK